MIIFTIIGYLVFYLGRSARAPREQSGGDSAPPSDSVQCVVCLGAEREVIKDRLSSQHSINMTSYVIGLAILLITDQ
jgi:hypothetical protein